MSYQITLGSLYNGDNFSGALTRVAGQNAGSYAIQQGTLSAGNNYSLGFIGANLTIQRRTLNAQADDKSRMYGKANPAFTISYSGFAYSDHELSAKPAHSGHHGDHLQRARRLSHRSVGGK